MEDSDPKASSKARFKSKWSRVLKPKDPSPDLETRAPAHTNSFTLDDDVTAFLKPSTDRAASARPGLPSRATLPAPKLDIAIAQRWPEAHEVRRASAATPNSKSALGGGGGEDTPNRYTKPKRRKGLNVGFVRQAPEVIGEGGDECEECTAEIGRRRAEGRKRSVSDARILAQQVQGGFGRGGVSSGFDGQRDFAPSPLRRAQTDFSDDTSSSAPGSRGQASPPKIEVERPGLSRTPTGFGSQDSSQDAADSSPEAERYQDYTMPKIDTRFAWEDPPPPSASTASPKDPLALAVRKRELRSSEGLTLRRASAMITDDVEVGDEAAYRRSLSFGVQPPQQHYDTLSRPDAPDLMPEPRSALSPLSALSPMGPSPFEDPKYVQRRSRDVTPEPASSQTVPQLQQQASQQGAPQSLRQQRHAYQPSYMRAAQQQQQQVSPQPSPPIQQQRAAIPEPPKVQPPQRINYDDPQSYGVPQVSPPVDYDEQASYMRPAQQKKPSLPITDWSKSPTEISLPVRPPPAPSETMAPPQLQYQSDRRGPSPMRDRIFGNTASSQAPQPIYSRPNGSNGSLNNIPPSPKHFTHSRSSSRDAQSPYSDLSGGPSQPSPTRFQTYSQSPPHGSPRSSIIGPSPLSPYAAPSSGQPSYSSQHNYLGAAKAPQPQPQTLLPPPGVGDPSSRPVSASSNRSFSRPRPPQMQHGQAPAATMQPEQTRQPSWSSAPSHQPPPLNTVPASQYSQQQQQWSGKSAASSVRQQDAYPSGSPPNSRPNSRPTSLVGAPSTRSAASPQSNTENNAATTAAYDDFATRVEHMKGVFRLTAQKERPNDYVSPQAWLRCAMWWYLRGKAGLEALMQQNRPRSNDGQMRELLTQPHVDLAKTWWILSDSLALREDLEESLPQLSIGSSTGTSEAELRHELATLRSHFGSLCLSMGRNQLMPPPASLIQGQDTTIWLEYPRFGGGAAGVLTGAGLQPFDALPLGDSRDVHCYSRFVVDVSMSTDDAANDRVNLPCMLTVTRGKREFVTTIVIASQNELVNVRIAPRSSGEKGIAWHDVSWKASSCGVLVRLPHQYDLMVRMGERDFRTLWNLVEYARKVEHGFRPEEGERLVLETKLAEMQFADSSNSNAFPSEKIKGAIAAVFERTVTSTQGGVERRLHRGYRLLLVTDPKNKSLASTSHEICRRGPFLFEFITDSAAGGMAAMVVRVREETRQCRILLVFPDGPARQNFYDVLNGMTVNQDETIVGKMGLAALNIESALTFVSDGAVGQQHPALQTLQWQRLGITNALSDEEDSHHTPTIASDSLRIVARHAAGCITDRLNLSKGELLLRLPCTTTPSIQILRSPQEDLTISLDTRQTSPQALESITDLHHTIRTAPTIRTLTFPSYPELHAFQSAITGCAVRYDGIAAVLNIARRRMVVPIYKKWEASNVRLQIIMRGGVTQVVACMEGFSHAEALCFQVKSTDVFETCKVGKRVGVRLVDAKFALPAVDEHEREKAKEKKAKEGKKDEGVELVVEEESPEQKEERVKRRFVNLEGLEYMSEHDDITVGFETVEERDRFAEALPTPATVGRGFTLKRRI